MVPGSPERPFGHPGVCAPTSHQAASFDRFAIEARGVPEPALMENAGRQTALIIQHLFPRGPVTALVGSGNNGGDALVCLRSLAAWGRRVTSVVVGKRFPEDPVLHGWDVPMVRFEEAGGITADMVAGRLRDAAVVVDGLLGTGIRGAPRSRYATGIAMANAAGRPIVALDTPSGVDGATGAVPGAAIRADLTVAFGWPKMGTLLHPARAHCGRIVAVEIGFPPDPAPDWPRLATPGWASRHLPRRPAVTHKHEVGALAILAGSAMPGAAILAARSAFRCGAGLVRVCASRTARDLLLEVPDAIFVDAGDEDALASAIRGSDALAVGPGLGIDRVAARQLAVALDLRADRPVVLDADALTLLAHDADGDLPADERIVVTPHPGEMARLTALSVPEVQRDRVGSACAFAAIRGVVTLLKGTPSLVADPRGGLLLSATEHASALAVAGIGDVLTGAIGSFLAQGVEPATACGLALHVTGRSASSTGLGASLMPADVVDGIAAVLSDRKTPVSGLPFPFVTFDQSPPS